MPPWQDHAVELWSGMRLLVVEDYAPTREALVRGLTEEGFAVDGAATGAEARWYARGNPYAAVILDLMLPDDDGLAILRDLRAGGEQAQILILTAKDAVADRVTGLNAGADDYLAKPFAFEELLARIQALLRRTTGRKDPVMRIGDLLVDPRTRVAERAGQRIDLTRREFALLELLARHAGEVVARETIVAALYDFATDRDSNVIDVYIGYLRRKLERPGEPRLLHTHRGHGYRLGTAP